MSDDIPTYRFKVCLLGDSAVGKTSLIRRAVKDEFDDNYITTLGAKVTAKTFKIDASKLKEGMGIIQFSLSIWDIIGQEEYLQFLELAYQAKQDEQAEVREKEKKGLKTSSSLKKREKNSQSIDKLPPVLPKEMEEYLRNTLTVTAGNLRLLALDRANRAKDFLIGSGPVEPERLFIIEPQFTSLTEIPEEEVAVQVKMVIK